MIKVLFFGKLSEQLGVRELAVEMTKAEDTEQLFQYLLNYNADWSTIFYSERYLKAVNQTIKNDNVVLNDGDEVAYFPPVTGG